MMLAHQTGPRARGTVQSDRASSPFERGFVPTIHPSLPFEPQDSPGSVGSSPGRYRRRPDTFGILGTDAPTVKNTGVRKRDVNDASRWLRSHLPCIAGPSRSGKGGMSGYTTPQRSVMPEDCETPRASQSGACDGDCCSVCYSPMVEKGLCDEDGRYVFTLPCSHRFHLRCLQKSREFNIDQCPMCRAPIPAGFTPQVVKERRRRQLLENSARVRDITNMWTSREVMVGRAATAREAVRLAALRRIREQEEANLRMMQRQTASLTLRQSPSDGVDDGTDDVMDEDDAFPLLHEGSMGLCCSHCEHPLCERQDVLHPQTCYVCMQPFCARCSTLDYRTRQERAICLDCLVHQRP